MRVVRNAKGEFEIDDEPMTLTGEAAKSFLAEMERERSPEEKAKHEAFLAECQAAVRKVKYPIEKKEAELRERVAELEERFAHECTAATVLREDLLADQSMWSKYCRLTIVDAEGKARGHYSRGCVPIVDNDWWADTRYLLGVIDRFRNA